MPDRTAAAPSPAAGGEGRAPPVIALAGNKPSWREREAAKAAAGGAPAAQESSAPAAAEAPKRSGYVPPALRGEGAGPRGRPEAEPMERTESRGGTERWKPKPREGAGRDGSPADAPAGSRYQPPGSRRDMSGTGAGARDGSAEPGKFVPRFKREAADGGAARGETPPASARTESPATGQGTAGKYVPRFRREGGGA
jgi:translation initiation factor 3 subunit A